MSLLKKTVESQLEAVAGISAEKAGEREAPEGRYVFRTEWERQNFLSRMTKQDVLEAQAWIREQRQKYPGTLEALFAEYDRVVLKYASEKWGVESETRANLADAKADRASGQARVVSDAGGEAAAALSAAEKSAKDAKRSAEKAGSFEENYDRRHAKEFQKRLSSAAEAIDKLAAAEGLEPETKAKLEALAKALREFAKNPTPKNALAAQNAALALDATARFTAGKNDGKPDSLFGPITMAVVEKIAKIRTEVSENPSAVNPGTGAASGNPSATPGPVPSTGPNGGPGPLPSRIPGAASNAPVAPSRPGKPGKPGSAPSAVPVAPEARENVPYATVLNAYEAFMKVAKETDVFGGGFRKSDADIAKDRQRLDSSLAYLVSAMKGYEASGNPKGQLDWMKINLSYYYSDDLSGISAGQKKDLVLSQNIAIDLLNGKVKALPGSQEEIFETLESLRNTKIGDLIAKQIEASMANGEQPDIFRILSNPMVKGGWERAYEKVLEKNLAELDASIAKLEVKRASLTETERKALDHLIDIRGKGGMFDFKATNRDQMWQMLKYGAAIGAGIVGSALVASGVGAMPGALLISAAAGGAITTGGGMLARGSRYSLGEGAGEFAINTATFGLGGLLFRVANGARAVEFAAKAGTAGKVALYSVEGFGNVGIGVAADSLRAELRGEDLDLWNSIQQNLIWAALPFALRAAGAKIPPDIAKDADALNAEVRNVTYLQRLGRPVTGVMKNLKARSEALAEKVRSKFSVKEVEVSGYQTVAETRSSIAADIVTARKEMADLRSRIKWNRELLKNPELNPVTRKKLENEIFTLEGRLTTVGKQVDGNVAFAPKKDASATPPKSQTAPETPATPAAATEVPAISQAVSVPEVAANLSDSGFRNVVKEFGSRLKKAGDKFEGDGITVTKTKNGFELKAGDSIVNYDTLDDLSKGLANRIKTPGERFDFLAKFGSEKLQKRLAQLNKQEVGEGYRIVHRDGKISFEKKSGDGWEPVKSESVPESVQNNAAEAVFGSKGLEKVSGLIRNVEKNPESLASSGEKKKFVEMFGNNAWLAAMRKFESDLAGFGATPAAHGHGGGFSLLKFAVGDIGHGWRSNIGIPRLILGQHGSSWKGAVGFGAASQLSIPAYQSFSNGNLDAFRNYFQNFSEKDAVETLAEILLFRYVSWVRAIVYNFGHTMYEEISAKK